MMAWMPALHIIALVLATLRFTDLLSSDRITAGLRSSFPGYVWSCGRCLSVWAGMIATALFTLHPFLNWPMALSWIYLAQRDFFTARLMARQSNRIVIVKRAGRLAVETPDGVDSNEVLDILAKAQMIVRRKAAAERDFHQVV